MSQPIIHTYVSTIRGRFVTAASMVALLSAMPSIAQAAEPQEAQGGVEEVIVTGSRIVRNGYEAPTPVTVVGIEQLQDTAKANIAEALNEMPVFQGSTTMSSSGTGNGGTSGGNNINLRNLGANRTLVLFDGRRFPPALADGTVDINLLPDSLVSRVDVVTGGASAVYGSDALIGVVNFVLDTTFTGIKGTVQGGVTDKGDGRNYKVSLAYGTNFANDRGHFIISGDNSHQDAIDGDQRDWNQQGWYYIQNPARTATNGLPQFILSNHVGLAGGYPGGIIYGGPLKGIAFGAGGTPFQWDYGQGTTGQYQIGGDWKLSSQQGAQSIMIKSNMTHLFADLRYDITDDIQVFAQFNNADVQSNARCCFVYYLTGNLTVHPDNPFMPASVAARATALNITNIPYSMTIREDPHGFGMINERLADTYAFGAKGKANAFETSWSWNAYLQRGISKESFWVPYQVEVAKFMAANDAVRAPNGSIVCRSNLTGGNPGCVPYNIFGTGVNTSAAFTYIMGGEGAGGPRESQTLAQNVAGASITGEPFSSWAGPVSVALSGEYRKDTIKGINDAVSPNIGWFSTQLTGFNASQSVVEGAVETVVPLAKNETWAKALDLNAAFRFTHYSVAGSVQTWKIGATYTPVDDVRIRVTQSRDIRAPNLQDLFSAPVVNHNTIPDPFKGNLSYPYYSITQGNTGLQPEKGDTTGIGVVYQPSWFSGFSMSIVYYRINIKAAISSPGVNYTLAQCFAGVAYYCGLVARFPAGPGDNGLGTIYSITTGPQNQAKLLGQGVDYEASYQTALSDLYAPLDGNLNVRVVATNVLSRINDSGIAGPTQVLDSAGIGASPRWGVNTSVTYSLDKFRVLWTGRFISRGRQNSTSYQCTSGCPTVSGFNTVDNNYLPPYFLQNLSFTYRFYQDGSNNAEAFFVVDNLMDKQPPPAPNQFAGATYGLMTNAMYDTIGRRFRAGVRFKM